MLSVADVHKTIYVDRMEGLEPFVERALRDAELPFDFIEEQAQPALKAGLAKLHSDYGEIVYKHKLGRNETHRLELVDLKTGKTLAWHQFELTRDDASRKRAAEEFAAKVRRVFKK